MYIHIHIHIYSVALLDDTRGVDVLPLAQVHTYKFICLYMYMYIYTHISG